MVSWISPLVVVCILLGFLVGCNLCVPWDTCCLNWEIDCFVPRFGLFYFRVTRWVSVLLPCLFLIWYRTVFPLTPSRPPRTVLTVSVYTWDLMKCYGACLR
jgi:hypothetical protein